MARYVGFVALLVAALGASASKVDGGDLTSGSPNPVEGVVKLLTRLEKKIQTEGKDEAAAYDKFACFCKEQADAKLFSINKAGKRIDELSASIKKLTAGIEEFTSDMEEAKEKKAKLEEENEKATGDRKAQHEEHLEAKADLIEAIDEILDAQQAVKDSADKQAGLVQLSARTTALIMADPGEAKDYAFKGGKTLKKLEELHKDFKGRLKKLMEEEAENKHTHDMAEGARNNEIMAKASLITKCQTVIGEKSQQKSDNEKEKSDQEKNKSDDEEFLNKVTDECEEKAGKWDARSKRRSNELTAISECLGILKGDATSKYGAAKLALAQSKAHKKGHWVWSPSFLQIRAEPKGKTQKAVAALAKQASLLKSSTLEALVMALRDNPFNSVKKMIEDLIKKIDKEQEDEDQEIEDCKNDIKDNTKKRAKNAARMEEEEATVVEESAAINEYNEDAETLGKEIAELYKGLNEATELRAKESKENAVVLKDAKAGQKSMEQAIKVLKDFYDSDMEKGLFLQKEPEIKELDAGGFLGDDADADISKQDEAKGIFGLLGTIKDDYDNTIKNTEQDEKDAESEFNTFKTSTETEVENKEKAKSKAEKNSRKSASDVEQAKEDLIQWTKQKTEAEYELSILTPRCLGLGASAEERKKRREEEKKALNDAISILEAMGPAEAPEFLQK